MANFEFVVFFGTDFKRFLVLHLLVSLKIGNFTSFLFTKQDTGIQIPWGFPLHYLYICLLGDIRLCISWAFPIYSFITWYSFTTTEKYSWYSFIMDIRLLGTWEYLCCFHFWSFQIYNYKMAYCPPSLSHKFYLVYEGRPSTQQNFKFYSRNVCFLQHLFHV